MRVLHVDTGRQMRGGQWQVLYLLEGWAQTGEAPPMQYTLLAPAEAPLFTEARERGFNVIPFSIRELFRRASRNDLVHAHDARAHTVAALVGRAPLVVSRRVAFPVRGSLGSRWKYGRAAMYLAVSNFVSTELQKANVPAEKIRVVYDGVPVPPLGRDGRTGIVALSGKCESTVREAAGIAGVSVEFTSNLWEDLARAGVFVYISELEGLGSAALAAMAAGVPVIAAKAGGLAEVVEHGQTGLLIESPASPHELAAAIRRLFDHPQEAAEMGRKGREGVAGIFPWRK